MTDSKPYGTDALTHEQQQASLRKAERRGGLDYHTREWSFGKRGGGKMPDDFGWRTNPKQYQEESGSARRATEADLSKERWQKR